MNYLIVFVGAGLGGAVRHACNELALRWVLFLSRFLVTALEDLPALRLGSVTRRQCFDDRAGMIGCRLFACRYQML